MTFDATSSFALLLIWLQALIEDQEHMSFHCKRQNKPLTTVAPDGYQVNKPESEFGFLRPPSSTDERVIIPLIGTNEFIQDELCTMPEELKKLDIDSNLWSNWVVMF